MKEGESVTLDSPVEKNNNHLLTWYFNDTRIAGDQSKICTDVQCKDRFKDRLDVDLFGSLTITNTRTTDSGLYTLQIIISDSCFSITREKRFSVTVTGESHLTICRKSTLTVEYTVDKDGIVTSLYFLL